MTILCKAETKSMFFDIGWDFVELAPSPPALDLELPAGILVRHEDDLTGLSLPGRAHGLFEKPGCLVFRKQSLRLVIGNLRPLNREGDPKPTTLSPSRASPCFAAGDHVTRVGLCARDAKWAIDTLPESRWRSADWDRLFHPIGPREVKGDAFIAENERGPEYRAFSLPEAVKPCRATTLQEIGDLLMS